MLLAWQPNSLASSLGVGLARTSSIICSRNYARYGCFDMCGLDTSDSCCENHKVSAKWGQFQSIQNKLFARNEYPQQDVN